MDPGSPSVPAAPLPLPRAVRVALLGDANARTDALQELFGSGGRQVARHEIRAVAQGAVRLDADVAVVASPIEDVLALAERLAPALADVVVVCSTTLLPQRPDPDPSTRSGVAAVAAALPAARVVGALQQFTVSHLELLALRALETDAPVVADDREAGDLVEALLDELPGVHGVFAGALRNAGPVEAIGQHLAAVADGAGRPVGFRLDPLRGLVLLFGR